MVATVGIAQILAGLATALPLLLGGHQLGQRLPSPFDLSFSITDVVFHGNDVLALIAVPLVVLGLVQFLRRTPYGIAIRACAESSDRASLLGVNVPQMQRLVWVATAVLSAIAMILRAGVLGLPIGSAFGPQILLRALAAAVIGRMESYPRMFLAASAIGILETAIIWNENSGILIDPVLLVIVIGFLLVQRRDRESRVADQSLSSWRAATLVRAVPKELAALPEVRGARWAIFGAIGALLVALPYILSESKVNLMGALFVFCIIAVSLVVLTGWAGEITLGQMAFVAVGAATGAVVNVHLHWDLVPTILLSGVVGAVFALVVGLPALRVRGLFLAVTTLAFAVTTSSVLLNRKYVGMLPDNTTERVRRLPLFGRTDVTSERSFYFVCLGILVIVLWVVRNLQKSRLRRVLVATRDNERSAQAFGVDLTRTRLLAFAVSGFLASLAGGLFSLHQQALGHDVFAPAQSLRALTMVVIGGLGSIPGALLGALFLKSTEWFNTLVPRDYRFFFTFAGSGVGLLVVMLFLPGGLSQPFYALRDRYLRGVAKRRSIPLLGWEVEKAPRTRSRREDLLARFARSRRGRRAKPLPSDAGAPVVEVRNLDVYYGQVQVLFGVDVTFPAGGIVALLGTNGAGKSTLLRAISGLTPPAHGSVSVSSHEITGRPPHRTARDGIVQVPGGKGVFPTLTVAEHLRLAAWTLADQAEAQAAVERVLEFFPVLRERHDSPAALLSGGQQQMLTLGMAFVAQPRVLMIDELSLGLAPVIVERLLEMVRAINEAGTTVVLVEQSVNVALTVADTAYFMEKGEIRFSGPTRELLERPDILRSVYMKGAAAATSTAPTPAARTTSRIDLRERGVPIEAAAPVVLEVSHLAKSFAGRTVIDDVSIQLHKGEILGIIGPNGAGKTTLFDLISGFLTADSGEVRFQGEVVNALRPDQRARLGLARSFQDARLFNDLTVLETLQVALDWRLDVRDPVAAALGLPAIAAAEATIERRAEELIELFGLGVFRDKFAVELSTGSRRIVDIACQFALEPRVVLFDEPSSGIAQREAEALAPVLFRIRDEIGTSLLVIEHDMPLLTSIADRFVALDIGRVVCDGDAATVFDHPDVIASYLGSDRSVIERSGSGSAPAAKPRRKKAVAST
jgi:ABC-type branched-subunit amino acid transport system ATPase component/ABC-type branched-subunit amino acid transport system permease subunit